MVQVLLGGVLLMGLLLGWLPVQLLLLLLSLVLLRRVLLLLRRVLLLRLAHVLLTLLVWASHLLRGRLLRRRGRGGRADPVVSRRYTAPRPSSRHTASRPSPGGTCGASPGRNSVARASGDPVVSGGPRREGWGARANGRYAAGACARDGDSDRAG